jgi:hypothetical protein
VYALCDPFAAGRSEVVGADVESVEGAYSTPLLKTGEKPLGVWCMVYGVWCMVYGVWCTMYGVRCMVYGIWCIRCMVY